VSIMGASEMGVQVWTLEGLRKLTVEGPALGLALGIPVSAHTAHS